MSESTTQAWTPLLDANERAAVSRIPPRAPFLLMAHRERWGVSRGKVRPVLGRLHLIPGVANVSVGPKGSVRIGMAKTHYEERGWTIIATSTLPPKQTHRGSYLSRPAGRDDVTLLYWEEAFPGSTSLRSDDALQDEFLDYLVASGIVPPPPLYVLERLRDDAAKEYAASADRAQVVPSYKLVAKAAKDRLAVLEAAIQGTKKGAVPVAAAPVLLDDAE